MPVAGQIENATTKAAKEMVMVFAGEFVVRRLARHEHAADLTVLLHRVQRPIHGDEVKFRQGRVRDREDLRGGQWVGGTLQGGADRATLAGVTDEGGGSGHFLLQIACISNASNASPLHLNQTHFEHARFVTLYFLRSSRFPVDHCG